MAPGDVYCCTHGWGHCSVLSREAACRRRQLAQTHCATVQRTRLGSSDLSGMPVCVSLWRLKAVHGSRAGRLRIRGGKWLLGNSISEIPQVTWTYDSQWLWQYTWNLLKSGKFLVQEKGACSFSLPTQIRPVIVLYVLFTLGFSFCLY